MPEKCGIKAYKEARRGDLCRGAPFKAYGVFCYFLFLFNICKSRKNRLMMSR